MERINIFKCTLGTSDLYPRKHLPVAIKKKNHELLHIFVETEIKHTNTKHTSYESEKIN